MGNKRIIEEDIENVFNSGIDWSPFFNRTVLISGASGFLPAYLVETLLFINSKIPEANIKVVGLVRNPEKALIRFGNLLDNTHFELLIQDVCTDINTDIKIDFIIHAASQASPKYYGKDPVGTINANVLGTLNLLKLAQKNSVQSFLYFSSSEVYGKIDDKLIPTKEDWFGTIDPCNIRSCYSEGKRAGETICISWCYQYNIPIKIVRPFHTYGPGMDLSDGRVYADFVKNVVSNQNIEMLSDGQAMRAFCYISDATVGFFKVMLEGAVGNAYNIGNENEVSTIISLAKTLVALYPEKKLEVIQKDYSSDQGYIPSIVSKNIPDTNKMKLLNWFPKTSIKEGFFRTIKYYINEAVK